MMQVQVWAWEGGEQQWGLGPDLILGYGKSFVSLSFYVPRKMGMPVFSTSWVTVKIK